MKTYKRFLKETPWIEYEPGDFIDIEIEKHQEDFDDYIISLLHREYIVDKYNNVLDMKNEKDRNTFIKHLLTNRIFIAYGKKYFGSIKKLRDFIMDIRRNIL